MPESQAGAAARADGYELGAVSYHALRPDAARRRVAVLHGGAGIPAGALPALRALPRGGRHPGAHLRLSRHRRCRGRARCAASAATIEDWAEYDCGGAIAWLRDALSARRRSSASRIRSACLLARRRAQRRRAGAPRPGRRAYRLLRRLPTGVYRLPMTARLARPDAGARRASSATFPARRLGLGEDIPAGVALQWADASRARTCGRRRRTPREPECRCCWTAAPRCSARRW